MSYKTILLIGSHDSGDKNNVSIIKEQMLDVSYEINIAYWEDLVLEINNQKQLVTYKDKDIALNCNLVIAFNWYKSTESGIYRDLALAVALYLQKHNIPFWNSEMIHQRSTTKLSMMMQLAIADIGIPSTLFSLNSNLLIEKNNEKFPLILKAASASRGNSNYLIQTEFELLNHLNNDVVNNFLIQEYIPNDSDLRLVCMAGEAVMCIERSRQSTTTHLNNTSTGGFANVIDLNMVPSEILTNTEKICNITKREMAGVDWMIANDGSNRAVCLEVNAIPQITSGSNVNLKIASIGNKIKEYMH
jgi:glutathione synthase/RimK-type ligase-like ATP-grasp enzyme